MIKNLLLCYVVFNVCTALPMEQGKGCTPDVINHLMVRFFNFQNDPRFLQYCQKNPTAGHEIPISPSVEKGVAASWFKDKRRVLWCLRCKDGMQKFRNNQMDAHDAWHDKTRPHRCEPCRLAFSTMQTYESHGISTSIE